MPRDREQVAAELLVVRCRLGERAAWEQLVRDFEPKLLYFVRRLVDDESDALDVLQQTWLKVWRQIGTLEDAGALAPWLYRIARNTALNQRRVQVAYRAAIAEERNQSQQGEDPAVSYDDAEQVHYGLGKLLAANGVPDTLRNLFFTLGLLCLGAAAFLSEELDGVSADSVFSASVHPDLG